MSRKVTKRGISKDQWLRTALKALATGGVSGVRVDDLAKSLGIARSGFYWHFADRDAMLRDLLNFWLRELTEVVTADEPLRQLPPKDRLVRTAEMVLEQGLGRYEMAFRQWAQQDPEVARVVRKVNRARLDFTRDALRELGFVGDELEMRAMLFVCYHTWESTMFQEVPRKRLRALCRMRVDLLTG